MIKITSLFLHLLSLSTVASFSPRYQMSHTLRLSPRNAALLTDVESMCLLNSAELFLKERDEGNAPTDADLQEALINSIESQTSALEARIEEMQSLAFLLLERPRVASLDFRQTPHPVMNEMDTMCLLNTAKFCCDTGNECTLDDKEALVNRLNEQMTAINVRLLDMLSAGKRLKANPNAGIHMANEEEIESLMSSIQSTLTMDFNTSFKKVPVTSL